MAHFKNKRHHVENLPQAESNNFQFFIGYKSKSIGSVTEAASTESATTSL